MCVCVSRTDVIHVPGYSSCEPWRPRWRPCPPENTEENQRIQFWKPHGTSNLHPNNNKSWGQQTENNGKSFERWKTKQIRYRSEVVWTNPKNAPNSLKKHDLRSAGCLPRNAEKRGAGVHDCVAPGTDNTSRNWARKWIDLRIRS